MESQAVSPFWQDKALYVTLLGFIVPALDAHFGWHLDPTKLAGLFTLLIAYVVAHKAKSAKVLLAEIARDAGQRAIQVVSTLPPPPESK